MLLALAAGVALAAPAPVLRLTAGDVSVTLPLPDDATYAYGYLQSIYQVGVVETQRATDSGVAVLGARSSDRRSLEYYRWGDDTIRAEGGDFVQEAPLNLTRDLQIRVTGDGEQWIEAASVRVALLSRFGGSVVRLAPGTAPRAEWLLAHLTR